MPSTTAPRPGGGPCFGANSATTTGQSAAKHRLGQIGILRAAVCGVDQPAQMMHADAEMPFLRPAPRRIQLRLVIRDAVQHVPPSCGQQRRAAPASRAKKSPPITASNTPALRDR